MIDYPDKNFLNKIKLTIKKSIESDERLISEKSRHSPKTELLISIKDSVIMLMINLYSVHEQLYLINKALSKKMSISLETYKRFQELYLEDYLESHKKNRYLAARYLKIKKEVAKKDTYKNQFQNLNISGRINASIKLNITLEDYIYFVQTYLEVKKVANKNKIVAEHYVRVPTGNTIGPKVVVKKEKGDTLESVLSKCETNIITPKKEDVILPVKKEKSKIIINKPIEEETFNIKDQKIVVLNDNEQREQIIAKNGAFIIDTYPDMKLKNIPNRFEFITNKHDFPDEVVRDIDFMFAKMNTATYKFSEPFVYLPDRRLINAINPTTCGLFDGLLFICDTTKDKEYTTGYLFIRYYKNKLYLIEHFKDLSRSTELYIEFNIFKTNNYARNLAILVNELYNL